MVQDCFPKAGLRLADVRATWAGIRPLIQEPGKSTRDTSRHDQVWSRTPELVTVAGGKLTTYRPMARRTLKAVARQLDGDPPGPDRSAEVPLPGGEFAGQDPEAYRETHSRGLVARGVAPATAARLTWLYGRQLEDLIALADSDPSWLDPLHPDVPAVRGEALLAVQREMAATLIDFMDRRAALLIFSREQAVAAAPAAADVLAVALGWSTERREREVEGYLAYASEHAVPSPQAG